MEKGYAICLNEWALDKDIKEELGLLLIISSLCAEKGYCWASNKYLADLFDTTEVTISRKIKKLVNCNYLKVEYERRGYEVKKRILRLTKMLTDDYQICKSSVNKNVKENNTSIKNKKKIYKRKIIPEWFNEEVKSEKLTEEEIEEMNEIKDFFKKV
jgi:hypothetical protein